MKIALYVEEGVTQIVLTPESPHEKGVLSTLRDAGPRLSVYTGQFYQNMTGYIRQGPNHDSTILRIDSSPQLRQPPQGHEQQGPRPSVEE